MATLGQTVFVKRYNKLVFLARTFPSEAVTGLTRAENKNKNRSSRRQHAPSCFLSPEGPAVLCHHGNKGKKVRRTQGKEGES